MGINKAKVVGIILAILLISFLIGVLFIKQGRRMMTNQVITISKFDKSIIQVIDCLKCPAFLSQVSETVFDSASIIESSDLELIKSSSKGDKTVAVYKGLENGYLAVLQNDGKIYCAQYLNNCSTEGIFNDITMPEGIYYYTYEYWGGWYVKQDTAFFTDGRAYSLIYYNPNDPKPHHNTIDYSESILSLVNE